MFLLFLIETMWMIDYDYIDSYYIKITDFLRWLEIIEIEFARIYKLKRRYKHLVPSMQVQSQSTSTSPMA